MFIRLLLIHSSADQAYFPTMPMGLINTSDAVTVFSLSKLFLSEL
jgi:hypothetical protein